MTIKFVGLELRGVRLRMIHPSEMERSVFILQQLGPSLVMAYATGNPLRPCFQVACMQVANRISQGLWAQSKKQVEEWSEGTVCQTMFGDSWLLPRQLAWMEAELKRYKA